MIPINPLAQQGWVPLWTRQHQNCLKEIEQRGFYRVSYYHLLQKFDVITDHFAQSYRWFVEAAEKLLPRPAGVDYPIWCSVSEKNALAPEPDSPLLVLKVPEERVIYFSGQKWDFVLNHRYLPLDEADQAAFQQEMLQAGLDATQRTLIMDPKRAHFYPEFVRRIQSSWPRIFHYDVWDIFDLQANLWEIRKEDIQEIIEFN